MRSVQERPGFVGPMGAMELVAWGAALVAVLLEWASSVGYRLNGSFPMDGTERMKAPLPLSTYTLTPDTRPDPTDSKYAGTVIYVSDAAAGAKFQGCDGAAWINLDAT